MRTRTFLLLILLLLIAAPAASAPPPCVLTCPAHIHASVPEGATEAVVTYAAPVSSPGCIGAPIQGAGLPSGANFPIGTTLNCFAQSGQGAPGICCFNVTVTATALESAIPVPSGHPSTWWTLAALTLFAGALAATRWLR